MEVTARGDSTYRIFADYSKASIAVDAQEMVELFDYLLANIKTLQIEAIEAKRAQRCYNTSRKEDQP